MSAPTPPSSSTEHAALHNPSAPNYGAASTTDPTFQSATDRLTSNLAEILGVDGFEGERLARHIAEEFHLDEDTSPSPSNVRHALFRYLQEIYEFTAEREMNQLLDESKNKSDMSLEMLGNLVASLTEGELSVDEVNECVTEGEAAYYSIWEHMTTTFFSGTGIKSFSPPHVSPPTKELCVLHMAPPNPTYTESSKSFNEGKTVLVANDHVLHSVVGRGEHENTSIAVGLKYLPCSAEAHKLIKATLMGILKGKNATKFVDIQLPITDVVAGLKERVDKLAFPFAEHTIELSSSANACLKLLARILHRVCPFKNVLLVVGRRNLLPNNGVNYVEKLCVQGSINSMRSQVLELPSGDLEQDNGTEMDLAISSALLFGLNCTWEFNHFGSQIVGYVNIADTTQENRQVSFYDVLANVFVPLRRMITKKTVYQDLESISYHQEGAVTPLPIIVKIFAYLYFFFSVFMGFYVGLKNLGKRNTVFEKISDGFSASTMMLFGALSVLGILTLSGEEDFRSCISGEKILRTADQVRRYLGLGTESEVKALLASAMPSPNWLDTVNTSMLNESRLGGGNICMLESVHIRDLLKYDARIIGNSIEWLKLPRNEEQEGSIWDDDTSQYRSVERRKMFESRSSDEAAQLSNDSGVNDVGPAFISKHSVIG